MQKCKKSQEANEKKEQKENQKAKKKPLDIYILYYEIWSDIYYVCTDVCTTLTLADEEEEEEETHANMSYS